MAVLDAPVEQKARAGLRVLARRARVRAAYLFGSRVEGTADRWSDIDVAAFIETSDRWDLERRVGIRVEARQLAGDDVELHLFPASALDRPEAGSFAAYVIERGVPINLNADHGG